MGWAADSGANADSPKAKTEGKSRRRTPETSGHKMCLQKGAWQEEGLHIVRLQ